MTPEQQAAEIRHAFANPRPVQTAEPETGAVDDVLENLEAGLTGFYHGFIDAPEQYARAARVLGLDTTKIIEYIEKHQGEPDPAWKEGTARWMYEGLRSIVPSMAAGIPGAVAGAVGGAVTTGGLGAIPSAIIGYGASGGTIFGLAEYDKFMEEGIEAGYSREELRNPALLSAFAEGGFEAATDVLEGLTLKLGSPLKAPMKSFLKRWAVNTIRIAPIEMAGEAATAATQSVARGEAGLPTAPPGEAAQAALGPAGVASVGFGGIGSVAQRATSGGRVLGNPLGMDPNQFVDEVSRRSAQTVDEELGALEEQVAGEVEAEAVEEEAPAEEEISGPGVHIGPSPAPGGPDPALVVQLKKMVEAGASNEEIAGATKLFLGAVPAQEQAAQEGLTENLKATIERSGTPAIQVEKVPTARPEKPRTQSEVSVDELRDLRDKTSSEEEFGKAVMARMGFAEKQGDGFRVGAVLRKAKKPLVSYAPHQLTVEELQETRREFPDDNEFGRALMDRYGIARDEVGDYLDLSRVPEEPAELSEEIKERAAAWRRDNDQMEEGVDFINIGPGGSKDKPYSIYGGKTRGVGFYENTGRGAKTNDASFLDIEARLQSRGVDAAFDPGSMFIRAYPKRGETIAELEKRVNKAQKKNFKAKEAEPGVVGVGDAGVSAETSPPISQAPEGSKGTTAKQGSQEAPTYTRKQGPAFRKTLAPTERTDLENWAGAKDGKWHDKAEAKVERGYGAYEKGKSLAPRKINSIFGKLKKWLVEAYKASGLSEQGGFIAPFRKTKKAKTKKPVTTTPAPKAPVPQVQKELFRTEEEATKEIPPEQSAFDAEKNDWLGNKDKEALVHSVEERKLQKILLKAVGGDRKAAQEYDKAIQIYIDMKRNPSHRHKFWNRLTKEQQARIELAKTIDDVPAVKAVADYVDRAYQRLGKKSVAKGVIKSAIDNYVGRHWKRGKMSESQFGSFQTDTHHRHERVWQTIIQGWALGGELKVEAATNNLRMVQDEVTQVIENRKLIDHLSKTEYQDTGKMVFEKERPDNLNYVAIEHPHFRIDKHRIYAPAELAKRINKIVGKSTLKGNKVIDELTLHNAAIKAYVLQTSFFHHLAFARSYWFGTNKKKAGEMGLIKAYKQGMKDIEQMKPELMFGVRNGLTLGKFQDWAEDLLTTEDTIFKRALDKVAPDRPFKDWMKGLRERQAKFLFQNFGAGLKARAYLIEYRNALEKHPEMNESERAQMVAGLVNADFGGLHLGRMERDPTAQHIFRLFALAPDWTESNIQTVYGMFKRVQGMPKGSPQQLKAQKRLYRRFWAGALTKGIMLTVLADLAMAASAGEDPWENFKKAWGTEGEWRRLRWLYADVTPLYRVLTRAAGGTPTETRKYFPVLGHFRDPIKWALAPIRSAHHKGSILYRVIHEAIGGTDWQGRGFTTAAEFMGVDDKGYYKTTTKNHKAGDPKGGQYQWQTVRYGTKGTVGYAKMPSFLLHTVRSTQPVQVQELIGYALGENEWFEALGRAAGLGVVSTYTSPRKLKAEFVNYYKIAKKNGGNITEIRRQLQAVNARRKRRGEDPIEWQKVKATANEELRLERKRR